MPDPADASRPDAGEQDVSQPASGEQDSGEQALEEQGSGGQDSEHRDSEQSDTGRLIAERYRLRTRLGGGAMGTVWSGVDELLRRPIAVKAVRLPPGMPEHEAAEIRERTLREARAIAVIAHPNVVTLYDVAREDGEPFVVMELVPSSSLATIVREHGPLDERQLALLTEALASALESAHQAGVVHRDVKPGNVLLAEDGRIKLNDFGISRNLAEPTLTRTGIMLGTPAFIAPEVAAGEPATSAADLWGLGATLFAAAEGHPPYDTADNPLATITSVVRGPVPTPTRTGPIGGLIAGLMVKDPRTRLPLAEVRRRVQHLQPEPDAHPFAQLLAPEATAPRPSEAPERPDTDEWEPPAEPEPDPEPAALAADPGPLPFTPNEPEPARRSPWALVALSVGAVLVFLLAAGGGFAASRMWTGRPLLPTTSAPPDRPEEPVRLVPYVGEATYPGDGGAGRYTLGVPRGWSKFQGYREEPLTGSLTVHFVSPDGSTELAVERFGGYYARGYTTRGYISTLPEMTTGTGGGFRITANRKVGAAGEAGHRGRYLAYTTTTNGITSAADSVVRRATFARLLPHDGDLWVVRVTATGGDTDRAKTLFDRVAPGFTVLP